MLTKLHLQNFKSFKDAELSLGSFTLLVGANATGKSNIRDAFRFLHGIGRGYNLAEIIGEKWTEAGLQWLGIRGGLGELTFRGNKDFELAVFFPFDQSEAKREGMYSIQVHLGFPEEYIHTNRQPQIIHENLTLADSGFSIFEAKVSKVSSAALEVEVNGNIETNIENPHIPILPEIFSFPPKSLLPESLSIVKLANSALASIKFFEFSPDAMRKPSFLGQDVLGDRGENLSSVLFDICQDPQRKKALLQWVQELTPMDAVDFEFPSDLTGKVLLRLVESNGQKTTAYSASDGTLRLLAMLAALLGREPAKLYFFEELDNGIHPTRLHLLVQLIEHIVKERNIQIIATTHSPQLLRLLNSESLEDASLTYRLPHQPNAKIKRIMDIPGARQLIKKQDLARLYESGWLEDAVAFLESGEISA